jgi:glycosyltransferase involved in cell wall biosynthesis
MKKLLIFVDWFVPGFKAGGQIRSCFNLAMALKEAAEVYVVTSDRDMGDQEAYQSVKIDEWTVLDNDIRVLYLSAKKRGYKSMESIIKSVAPECIYLNSMFSFNFTLLPIEVCSRLTGAKPKIVLAPRGMLHQGALQYKKLKKNIFFRAFKIRGFHRQVVFHATNPEEHADVFKVFGKRARVHFCPDFPATMNQSIEIIPKQPGLLKCVFVARIAANKNLLFFLSVLKAVKTDVTLSVVGPVEDEAYWAACCALIKALPENITVKHLGTIPNEELVHVYRQHHLLVLTSQGESYGHVIFEALSNGRPVLISDKTPWKNLKEKNIGWELPLNGENAFVDAVTTACGWNQETFDRYCYSSFNFASTSSDTSVLKKQYMELFQKENHAAKGRLKHI